MYSFSTEERKKWLHEAKDEIYDVVIIGGGITGVGIALDAVTRGMKTALIEMQDFAGGTSSRSTKLVHGGLRYLKQFEVKMVADVGREREIVYNNGMHVTHPEWMLLPIYKKGTFGKYSTSVGLKVYDTLAGVKKDERRTMLSHKETLRKEPLLKQEGLLGGGYYVEYRTDDARLTMEVAKKAAVHGAKLINYMKAQSFIYNEEGKVEGVVAVDQLDGERAAFFGKRVVNATGPWVEQMTHKDEPIANKNLFHSKGVHIVIDQEKFPLRQSVYFDTPDGRMVFAIPRGNKAYIGTTDTAYKGDLQHPDVTKADKAYLLEALQFMFPDVEVTEADIESTWSGVRPLILEEGKSPSEISRKDEIWTSETGLLSIAGGKLTGYRSMAEEITDVLAKSLNDEGYQYGPSVTKHLKLSGGDFDSEEEYDAYIEKMSKTFVENGFKEAEARGLVATYGSNAPELLKLSDKLQPTRDLPQVVQLLVHYAVKYEMAMTPEDFFTRRTSAMFFDIAWVERWKKEVTQEMQSILGWSDEQADLYLSQLENKIEESK